MIFIKRQAKARRGWWRTALVLSAVAMSAGGSYAQETPKRLVLGIARIDGGKYNAEYVKDSKAAAFYRDHGIQAVLLDYRDLTAPENLKQYNVLLVEGRELNIHLLPSALAEQARAIGRSLKTYVAQGGSVLLLPQSVRYPGDQDEKYWNLALQPFEAEVLHEGVFDPDHQVTNSIKPDYSESFFYTANIVPHPALEHVHGLWLPLHSYHQGAGTVAMKYGPAWQVVVRGEKSARSFRSDPENNILTPAPDKVGTYPATPPIVAVRTLGRGRVACLALDSLYAGQNYGNEFWSHIVESAGDPGSGKKSDGMALLAGLVQWLGAVNGNNPAYGTAKVPEYQPVRFPESYDWDALRWPKLAAGWWKNSAKGILGAHTSYSDGTGSVAEYVKAAKAAGLSYIVFTDPLEQLTAEKLAALKAECKRNSDDSFYACPGVEFTDGAGVRWAMWGEKVCWPAEVVKEARGAYQIWDEQRKIVRLYGAYSNRCGFPPSAVIDYKQLRAAGAFPENLWWFYSLFPYTYEDGRLIADNTRELTLAMHDLRYLVPLPFTRIKAPTDVAAASRTALAGVGTGGPKENLAAAVSILNARASTAYYLAAGKTFVTYGGFLPVNLQVLNGQMEQNWQYTRGAQRIRLRIDAHSDAGIRDVKLLDASCNSLLRRFLPASDTRDFSQAFELVHDRQHWVVAEVTDGRGAKSYSNTQLLYCYKQGLFRCGDNLNILGPLGMYWHPDRNQPLPLNKDFRNAELLSVQGWDRGGPDCPRPVGWPGDSIRLKGIGEYPSRAGNRVVPGERMDVQLSSHNLQIVNMNTGGLMEGFVSKDRPSPAMCSVSRKVADNEYFERHDRMISPMDRMDHYIAWNYRRWAESIRNYRGDLMWHDGYIKFKKDIVLKGSVPIALGSIDMPLNPDRGWGNTFIAKDVDRGMVQQELKTIKGRVGSHGRLAGGGYAAVVNNPIGYLGILVPKASELVYQCSLPGRLVFGLGKDGQAVKAGTILRYAYVAANIVDDRGRDGAKMATLSRALDLDGQGPGYPVTVQIGKLLDATYFLTVAANGHEAAFAAGPQKGIGIDLPIKVEGCDENGCAAIYSSHRPWFRFIPVVEGTAYLQEPIDEANDLWVGNPFVCENKVMKLTLVADGQAADKLPLLEVHNPTDQPIETTVYSPPHTPRFGGLRVAVKLAAGSSTFYRIEGKNLRCAP